MDIPLKLTEKGDRLVYGIPLWYRLLMGAIAAIIVAAFAVNAAVPGPIGYVVLALVILGALYEERWTFDAAAGSIAHRGGLLVLARTTRLSFAELELVRLVPHVRGSLPGSDEERADNEAALAGGRSDDRQRTRSRHKKPFLNLVLGAADGTSYLVNCLPARRMAELRRVGAAVAELTGKRFQEG